MDLKDKIFILMAVAVFVESRLILLMDEKYEDCTEGGSKYIDYSGVLFDYINDTNFLLNGFYVFHEKRFSQL